MIRHILLIKFKAAVDAAQIAASKMLFERMPEKIEGVVAVEWGLNDSPEGLNKNFTHSVFMTFADEAARSRYLPHPEHEALKQQFVPLVEDIIVFDYSV
ncbi:MAG TPA: stress protein [Cellvibrio sp.]|nr:stress protein [Cellvibrio sp.]